MTAQIIAFKPQTQPGNGAREALTRDFGLEPVEADNMLACLWLAGFKIVPLDERDLAEP